MTVDISILGLCDLSYDSICKSISMMNDFVLKRYPCHSYSIDQLSCLDLQDIQRNTVEKILSSTLNHMHREFIGLDDHERAFFINRIH